MIDDGTIRGDTILTAVFFSSSFNGCNSPGPIRFHWSTTNCSPTWISLPLHDVEAALNYSLETKELYHRANDRSEGEGKRKNLKSSFAPLAKVGAPEPERPSSMMWSVRDSLVENWSRYILQDKMRRDKTKEFRNKRGIFKSNVKVARGNQIRLLIKNLSRKILNVKFPTLATCEQNRSRVRLKARLETNFRHCSTDSRHYPRSCVSTTTTITRRWWLKALIVAVDD